MHEKTPQQLAETANKAAQEAALVIAEIQKNDRIASLAAKSAAARAAQLAHKATMCHLYAQKYSRGSADAVAVAAAEEAAIIAGRHAKVAAEKAKWRSNPPGASVKSLMSQEQRFEDEIDEIEAAWDSGDIDSLVRLGALSPVIARQLKAERRR